MSTRITKNVRNMIIVANANIFISEGNLQPFPLSKFTLCSFNGIKLVTFAGGTNCLKNVSTSELVWAEQHVSGNRFLGSQELEEFLDMVMNRKGWRMPATPVEAKHLYNKLVDIALNGD